MIGWVGWRVGPGWLRGGRPIHVRYLRIITLSMARAPDNGHISWLRAAGPDQGSDMLVRQRHNGECFTHPHPPRLLTYHVVLEVQIL